MACRKAVVPTVNGSIEAGHANSKLIGIFDTIGYMKYENSDELRKKILGAEYPVWVEEVLEKQNHNQPLFLLDTFSKTEFRNYIRQAIDNAKVQCRSFDPTETPRLSSTSAIKSISASTGVILPLLSNQIQDSQNHNLRAAFLAGLAHGFGLDPFITQWDKEPAPVDFVDFITNVNIKREVDSKVQDYCQKTLIENQKQIAKPNLTKPTLLTTIQIGASAAENELQDLETYFVETAEFSRALRSRSSIVVGRKGSGKSAIYLMIRQKKAADRRNIVVDLNPASHNLSELRTTLLNVMDQGLFDHSIAAFWQYLLYAEILLGIREHILPKSKYNLQYQKLVQKIEQDIKLTQEMAEGDFTARLNIEIQNLVGQVRSSTKRLTPKDITNLLFENDMKKIRDIVFETQKEFGEIVLLFDNIDKGWPARGVEIADIRIVRLMIEALEKIQRDLTRSDITFRYLVFLRSDVFEKLVQETSDRGKYGLVKVDWADPEQLRNLLMKRLMSNFDSSVSSSAVWNAVIPVDGTRERVFQTMLNHCLMRPRFLIDLCERAISTAINRGHSVVSIEDMKQALLQHSNYLVSDFVFEIRDISRISEKIFYVFLGQGELFIKDELLKHIESAGGELPPEETLEHLLWYGFVGLARTDSDRLYIYSVDYDMKRLEAEIARPC